MKLARQFVHLSRRFYRPEQSHCPICQRGLRRAVTLTERTVITLDEVIKVVHAGYRCPDAECVGHQRTYRSVRADALALPWFTYGVDIVLLVGRLRLREHQTVDEIHQELTVAARAAGGEDRAAGSPLLVRGVLYAVASLEFG